MRQRINIVFLYPSHKIGGAQLLFIRLANEMSLRKGVKVYIVDYKKGFLHKNINTNPRIEKLLYHKSSFEPPQNALIITPLSNLSDISLMIKSNLNKLKILFWSIHPKNLEFALNSNLRYFLIDKTKAIKEIERLLDFNTIYFMDEPNVHEAKKIIENLNITNYLPIPIPNWKPYKIKSVINTKDQNKINLCWLGRVSYDKYHSILKLISEIESSLYRDRINLHIIGDGDKLITVKKKAAQFDLPIFFTGTLENKTLEKYLTTKIDIGVGMGTSCMEFAVRKIPAFLIDYSEAKIIIDLRYDWIFETNNYNLGSHVNETFRKHSFDDIIYQFKTDNTISDKCYEYVAKNHQLSKVADMIIESFEKTPLVTNTNFSKVSKALNPKYYRLFYKYYRILRKF